MYSFYKKNLIVPPGTIHKFLLMMKLVAILLIVSIMQVSASSYAQKITLSENQVSLKKVLNKIRIQTGYDFVFEKVSLREMKPVSINVKNEDLKLVLDKIFKDQPLEYAIEDQSVVVSKKESSLIEAVKDRIAGFFRADSLLYSGRVLDENGSPLPGANVRIRNTNRGVVTNELGRFSIKAPTTGATLFISYVGYFNSEVVLTSDNSRAIEVRMKVTTDALRQVEVVSNGYQEIAKERATGSFETVTAKQLQHSTDPNLLKRLEGITTAMNFNNNLTPTLKGRTSLQGVASRTNLTIRGKNTLNVGTTTDNLSGEPLIVIDGIASAYDISQINPNDVETVTLLKDAAAASIWGSRAANGVIVVTTKKGSFEKPLNISFNSNYNITQKPDLFYYKRMSTSDFIDAQKKQFIDLGTVYADPYYLFADPVHSTVAEIMNDQINLKTITEAQANAKLDALRGNDVRKDLERYLLRNTLRQSYSLGVDGGSKSIAYRLSGGYDRSIANVQGYGDNRLTLNYNTRFKITKNLELMGTLGYVQQNSQNQGFNTAISSDPTSYSPYDKLADDNGNPLEIAYQYRPAFKDALRKQYGARILDMAYKPLDEIKHGFNNINGQGYNMNLSASYKIISWLSANITYSYNRFLNNQETYYGKESYYMRELINRFSTISNGNVSYGIPKGGYDGHLINTTTNNTLRTQLNFNKEWSGKHILNAIGGIDINQAYNEYNASQVYGYDPDKFSANQSINYRNPLPWLYYNTSFQNQGNVPNVPSLLGYGRGRALSSYANASYTYKNRYTVSGSIRRDGSNAFASTTNKSGTPFYHFGGMWNIVNEPFYTFDLMPILKLRATYGYNGNTNPLMSPVARINRVDFSTSASGFLYNTLTPNEATNSQYRPERTGVLNLGLDYGIKGGRLSGSFEYYIKNTKDLISSSALDPSTGFSNLSYNVGDLRGYGIDFTLSSLNIQAEKFNWTSNFLLSYNRVKVTKLYVPEGRTAGNLFSDGSNGYTPGYDLSRLFAFRWAGLDPQTGSPRTFLNGNIITVSENQAGINNFNALNFSSPDNLRYMGSSVPVYFGSLRNTISYRGFSISANILYKFKYFMRRPLNDLFLSTRLFDGYNGNLVGAEYANRWQKPGDELLTNVPSLVFPVVGAQDALYQGADINVVKADHIRLQEINLSYSLRKKSWFLKNPTIYANVNNMGILWRANKLGIDPDIQDVPQPRTYSFGLSASF